MKTIKIYDRLLKRVLVTRGSARTIEPELRAALRDGRGVVELDFSGIEGLTPSFLDEVLRVLSAAVTGMDSPVRIIVSTPPTRLSSKFVAVGRSHGLSMALDDRGRWVITKEAAPLIRG